LEADAVWAQHVAAQPARGTPPTRLAQSVAPAAQLFQSVASVGPDWNPYIPVSVPLTSYAPMAPLAPTLYSVAVSKSAVLVAAGGLSAVADSDGSTNVGLGLFRELSGTVAKLQEMYVENQTQVAAFSEALNETRAEKELCQSRFEALDDYVTNTNADLDAQKKALQVEVDEHVRTTGVTDGELIDLFKKLLAAIPVLVKPHSSDV
jgi:hypothetical protein